MYLPVVLVVLVGVFHWTRACDIKDKGVSSKDKKAILKLHNKLRAKVAKGEQKGLKKAANMLEMTWDDDLASKAQKWAEKCVYKHDGDDGQNIGRVKSVKKKDREWKKRIQKWFDEVNHYNTSEIKKYKSHKSKDKSKKIGHFTQVIWAETNKIGCGYVKYRKDKKYVHLYGCNYSPAGNVIGKPVYKKGKPCSKCGGCGSIDGLCEAKE